MSRYSPGTICFVNYEYPPEMEKVNKAGYGNAIITGGNLSVFSGLSHRAYLRHRRPAAGGRRLPWSTGRRHWLLRHRRRQPVLLELLAHPGTRRSGLRSVQFPSGGRFNPMLMDLKPTLPAMGVVAQPRGGAFETVADMLDGDTPETAAGTAAYAAALKRYLRLSGGAFRTVNFLDGSDADRLADQLAAPNLALFGYSGDKGGGRWARTVVQVGPTLEAGLDGETQGDATPAEIDSVIQKTLQHAAPAGSACFLIVCVGDGQPSREHLRPGPADRPRPAPKPLG